MAARALRWSLLAIFALIFWGCSNSSEPAPTEAELVAVEGPQLDHQHREIVVLEQPHQIADRFVAGVANFAPQEPFEQAGFLFATWSEQPLDYRVRYTDGKWSDWEQVEVTWQDDELQVGRVLLEAEAVELEIREDSQLQWLKIEFVDEVVARTDVLTRDLPFAADTERVDNDGLATVGQYAIPDWVVTRSQWGARNPGKICGSAHNPYRQAIHHTVGPRYDGSNINSTMQGMQAFHIDTNGWCDIGYHFVVSQAGAVYQGRSREGRTGAHVGGQNTGNIGTSFIGHYDEDTPPDVQIDAAAQIVGWVGRTYSIPFNRTSIKGHQEHRGQATSCPGSNLLSRLDTLISKAANDDGGGPSAEYDVDVTVNWVGGQNFYTQGGSHNVADVLSGQAVEAEILIKNTSDDVIRNVWAGYLIEHPWLEASDYTIYTDYPEKDGATWVINDADEAPENPAKDALGDGGQLNLYAMSVGETKRIHVTLQANRYSIGAVDHPDVRGWLVHAEGANDAVVFGDRDNWDDAVETNELAQEARDYTQLDVLDGKVWLFDDVTNVGNLEGWVGAPADDYEELENNTSQGLLSMKVTGDDARILSPEWTQVPADTFDQLVLRARSHDGKHTKAVFWARDGESFSEERTIRFEAPGDGDFHDLVIPLSWHPEWTGQVERLRIDLLDGQAPGEEDSGWYDVDSIFFQTSADETTSAPGVDFVADTPVVFDTDAGGGTNDDSTNNDSTNNDDGNSGSEEDDNSDNVAVNRGCSATGRGAAIPTQAVWLSLLGGLAFARRMRQRG